MTRSVLQPGPGHEITVEPAGARVTVTVAGVLVAESGRALVLREDGYPERWYVPRADVRSEALRASATGSYCPYKGDCTYVSVVTPDGVVEDAGWEYRRPYPAVAAIAGHVAFYPERVNCQVG